MSLSLRKLDTLSATSGPVLLIVMDGVGIGRNDGSNAVFLARTPTLDRILASPLSTQLLAHGEAVGLPSDGDMGNSEIGHNALGAGRVFDQGAKLINSAIETGAIFESQAWKTVVERSAAGGTAHFLGLHSDGNVHSHIKHLYALLRRAAADGITRGRLHLLHDGRDVGAKSALGYIEKTEAVLAEIGAAHPNTDYRIASGGGRMTTTMDRYDADWSVVERGWRAHVLGQGRAFASAAEAVQTGYAEDTAMTDQYMDAFVITDEAGPVGTIEDGDSVVLFNFRGDRAIEISQAFDATDGFDRFDRVRVPEVYYAGMMEYDGDRHIPSHFLVLPPQIDRTMTEYLAAVKTTMFAVSETQKFGHVTYFWNGNKSGYIDEALESYHEIESHKIAFDQKPKMKALEITAWAREALRSGKFRFGRLNLANGDMVGHTGNLDAAVEAVEAVDQCVGELIDVVSELGGVTIVTADHGNCDEMWTEKAGVRQVKTSHTLNPVPLAIVDSREPVPYALADVEKPSLANVAATVMNLLGYAAPEDYEPSLIGFE